MFNWNFPPNNDGQNEGLNDAGIETYKGNPIHSLAREVIQNSLDAAHPDKEKPVKVEFTLHQFDRGDFPGAEKFKNILVACREFGKEIRETKKFFDKALEVFGKKQIPILQISDFNTTGLTGAAEDGLNKWYNLIKGDGISDKHVGAGGSFGIGKQAPFACSDLRTVFYSTKDMNGVKAFQGVSKLITHINKNGEKTQGTGFYGETAGNRPILDENQIDDFYKRKDMGTDIYIFAFKHGENWKKKIVNSILEHFFMAVEMNKLEASVGDIEINSHNISELLNSFDEELLAKYYYKSITSDENHYFEKEKFRGLGKLRLYIIPSKDFPKRRRVAMVRRTGMKIFDKGYFRTPMRFAGVLLAEGKELNEHLRKMEPPSHDDWEPERHPDKDKAESIRGDLYDWINDMVSELAIDKEAEKLDIKGMSQFLPDREDEFPIPSEDESDEQERTSPSENKKVPLRKKTPNLTTTETTTGKQTSLDENGETGTYDGLPGDGSNSTGGRYEEENTGEGEGEGRSGNNEGDFPTTEEKPLQFKSSRVFSLNPKQGIYQVNVIPAKTCTGHLKFKAVGEDRKDSISISKAKITEPEEKIVNSDSSGKVGPIDLKEDKNMKLIIHLEEKLKLSMEVNAYEN